MYTYTSYRLLYWWPGFVHVKCMFRSFSMQNNVNVFQVYHIYNEIKHLFKLKASPNFPKAAFQHMLKNSLCWHGSCTWLWNYPSLYYSFQSMEYVFTHLGLRACADLTVWEFWQCWQNLLWLTSENVQRHVSWHY